ncbi:hypothetical protein NQZ68_005625 [Dissostichus eleginoides]|nr:hypothetical protein NQZ68_005625 [Dissostichus eleginoides]
MGVGKEQGICKLCQKRQILTSLLQEASSSFVFHVLAAKVFPLPCCSSFFTAIKHHLSSPPHLSSIRELDPADPLLIIKYRPDLPPFCTN